MPSDPFLSACRSMLQSAADTMKKMAAAGDRGIVVEGYGVAAEEFGKDGGSPRPFARAARNARGGEWEALMRDAEYKAAVESQEKGQPVEPDYGAAQEVALEDVRQFAYSIGVPERIVSGLSVRAVSDEKGRG